MTTEKKDLEIIKDYLDKRFLDLEQKINCKNCKDKDINPFTISYLKKNVFTRKYLFNVILKSITKTFVLMFLTLFFLDLWNPFLDKIRTSLPWNNTNRKYFFRASIEEFMKRFKKR
ncbi:MAG: hypothetical protein AD073_000012 [Mycoplasmataceae bacterium]|nr:MAG: hypothetical protein AD073_000012 [Mycoplasmataceae bacterium]